MWKNPADAHVLYWNYAEFSKYSKKKSRR